jgi:hypothetical protein
MTDKEIAMHTTEVWAAIEHKIYEARDLVELAQCEHPEDYNLDIIHRILEEIIMEVE